MPTNIEIAFKDVMNDFIQKAKTEEQLSLYKFIALTAWNITAYPANNHSGMIDLFIKRFNCEQVEIDGINHDTKEVILWFANRKTVTYPDFSEIIISVNVTSGSDGLKYEIKSSAP